MSSAAESSRVFGVALVLGSAAIQAGCSGGSGDTTAPPGSEAVDSLVLNLDSTDVIVGDTVRLTAVARDAGGEVVPGVRLSYTSSDPAVATVNDDGLVTAVAFGVADIEVGIAGGASTLAASPALAAAVTANARSRSRVRGIPRVAITPGEQTLDLQTTSQYSATVTNVRGQGYSNVQVRWGSSDPAVAGIDASGLASTVKEGDTEISVTVTAGPIQVRARVPLHVAVCGGIFRVPVWDAVFDVNYKENGTAAGPITYNVDQVSTGGGRLTMVPGEAGADSTVWEGPTTGNVSMNNTITFPVPPPVNIGITSEVRSGAIQTGSTALARLTVKKPGAGSRVCTYTVQYGDYFVWSITNNQGAPPIPKAGPLGIALLTGSQVTVPEGNRAWALGSLNEPFMIPAKIFVGEPETAYNVVTTVGLSMIITLGGAGNVYGEAAFTHLLTATR